MNLYQPSSPFDPTEFITVAHTIAALGGEANLRTAIGRLYYGNFLLAREKSRIVTERDVHWEVIRITKSRSQFLGAKLIDLVQLRKLADYELHPQKPSDQDWDINWRIAKNISNKLLPGLQRLVQY